ncbi:MAG: radical SAM protein [Lachnospiraceae bacterium]|nr:radical SAM protein [Lachnospiraceae bacterium]
MDKLKRYVECYIPITTCNLQCHYCYITRQNKWKNEIIPIEHTPNEVARGLSKKRLGGKCLINMCAGGETLLCPDLVKYVKALLEEGHYVMVVTNGTIDKAFTEFTTLSKELLRHLIFKFSYHYLEHHRLGVTDRFFGNIKKMREAGCSFTLEITPNDELIPHIPEIKEEVKRYLGALCHITIARNDVEPSIPILTELSDEEFYETWGQFDSNLFNFKKEIFGKYQGGFCYAGEWSVYVHLGTGVMTQCYSGRVLDNIYENQDRPLHFEAVGNRCNTPHCYNGHAFLALGDIPELETPTYAQLRDRQDADGNNWLNEEAKSFLSCKLSESNKEYSKIKKWMVNRKK